MKFNERHKSKIPSILHFNKIGYTYLSLKDNFGMKIINIFRDIFIASTKNINNSKILKR